MRWYNHTLLAAAPAALIAPAMLPAVVLGATAPDWLEWLLKALRHPVKHRGPTHWLTVWLVVLMLGAVLPGWTGGVVLAFGWGGLSHVLADALTVSGVPFSPLSERRFHLLGGRLRTGGAGEYGIAWGVVLVCWVLRGQLAAPGSGYAPFFPNWAERYEQGTATAKEWRDNRFRFF